MLIIKFDIDQKQCIIPFQNGFKKNIKGIDYQNLTLMYENLPYDDDSLNELKQIIAFSEPLLVEELKRQIF